jgi:hypothetical protein
MTYTPAYNSLFIKPLVNQCIAIIQRDQASAIAIVNSNLAAISEFHKGPGMRTAFPWLLVETDGVAFDEDAHPYTRSQKASLSLALDIGQSDQEMAQDNAQDYARVLDMIVTTASVADWITSLPIAHETVPGSVTRPGAAGSVKEMFVASHNYSVVTAQEIQAPILRVTLALRFRLEET